IHEVVVRPFLVEELHRPLLELGTVELLAGPEVLLEDVSRDQGLVLGANEGAALPRLDVLELDDLVRVVVDLDLQTVAGLAGVDDAGHSSKFLPEVPPPSTLLLHLRGRHPEEEAALARVSVRLQGQEEKIVLVDG